MADNKMKGISRIDSKNTHGWFVRKYHQGRTYSRFFSDSRFESRDEALSAAKAFRRKLDERFPPPATTAFRAAPQKNSSTGVVGVSETFMRSRNGKKVPCFTVTWRPEKGVSRTKKFSINAYGRDEAFRLAVEFRREKEAEMLESRGKRKNKRE
jgi:hypothetical protein